MKRILFIFILLTGGFLFPQYTNTEQYPPGIDWRYIDIPNFRIVFPSEITGEGQRTANLLETLYPAIATSRVPGRRITLFLSNTGVFSNGYIQLAPWKGEFYSTPPQRGFNGNTEWYANLVLHEGKHVDQFHRLNRGFTRVGKFLFGDMGLAALSFLSVPMWFWEGEAVNTETEFSAGGRGRLPSFSMATRSILLAGKRYTYVKSYLSSYKDHIPDVYELGYFLTAWLRKNFPEDTVEKVLARASGASFYPFIFSHALRKETGLSTRELYRTVMDDLHSKWSSVDGILSPTPFREILKRSPRAWTLYTSPRFDGEGNITALRYGLDSPLTLVKITPGGFEKKITPLYSMDHIHTMLSRSAGKTVWAEPRHHIRWGNRSYSELVMLDLKSGEKTRLTRRSRLFSPAISPDGQYIAAARFSQERKTSLCILSAKDGKMITAAPSPENSFLMTPSWDNKGERMVMIRMEGGRRGVTLFDRTTGRFRDVLPLAHIFYSTPVFYKNHILFGSTGTGIDNIHAVDITTGEEFVVTSSRFGAFYPSVSPDGTTLLYSEYGLQGMRPVTAPLREENWTPFSAAGIHRTEYFRKGKQFPEVKDITEPERRKTHPVKKYNRWKGLLNLHSRVIVPDDAEPAVEVYSSNLLNDFFLTGGFSWNRNENRGKFYSEAVYAGLFPLIRARMSTGGRHITAPADLSWSETEGNVELSLPLNLSRGTVSRQLVMGAGLSSTRVSGSEVNSGFQIQSGYISHLDYRLSYSAFRHYAKRDLGPVHGMTFSLRYSYTPWDTFYRGNILSGTGALYLPGIFRHHRIRLGFREERQDPVNYVFSNRLDFPRGYDYRFFKKITSLSLDYDFPIAYPDLELGDIFYLKRIKGGFFADLGWCSDGGEINRFDSVGLELRGDLHLFSVPIELDIGARFTYRLRDNTLRIEPIVLGLSF